MIFFTAVLMSLFVSIHAYRPTRIAITARTTKYGQESLIVFHFSSLYDLSACSTHDHVFRASNDWRGSRHSLQKCTVPAWSNLFREQGFACGKHSDEHALDNELSILLA